VLFCCYDQKKKPVAELLQNFHKKLVLLGSDNPTTWIVYNHLIKEFGLFPAVIEQPQPRAQLLKNRVKKLGALQVADQLAFILAIRPYITMRAQNRIKTICHNMGLEPTEPLSPSIQKIDSVNSEAFRRHLTEINPDIIVVNGTRIIGKKTLSATKAIFINSHQGITPAYRGAHGAYWALYKNDKENCGVTVHLVDEGIDTGNIIGKSKIEPTTEDSFATYPYLQTAAALPILTQAIISASESKLATQPISGVSEVWYHPGFFQYIRGWMRGVR
jgi:folate-dependent phosphoribosylglycinamide formyltransferase PurN